MSLCGRRSTSLVKQYNQQMIPAYRPSSVLLRYSTYRQHHYRKDRALFYQYKILTNPSQQLSLQSTDARTCQHLTTLSNDLNSRSDGTQKGSRNISDLLEIFQFHGSSSNAWLNHTSPHQSSVFCDKYLLGAHHNVLSCRSIHTNSRLYDKAVKSEKSDSNVDGVGNAKKESAPISATREPKSKLEESVNVLIEKAKEKDEVIVEEIEKVQKPIKIDIIDKAGSKPEPVSEKAVAKDESPAVVTLVKKKSIRQRVIDEIKHYYHGFRLLYIDTKIAARLVWQMAKGSSLTRRERRQLVRTTADLFRLVPFSVFIIVPFMEFLLPVALKLFPQMLPSTFNEKSKEVESARKKLKGKLEMAKFLQDTIEEMALETKSSNHNQVAEFQEFMKKVRSEGIQTSTEEIMKYSQLFQDELTLDNLKYDQLVAMCKLINIPSIGTSYFLRFQLRMKLRQLEADDRSIRKEGIESLAVWELQEANRMRGMRALGCSEERLKDQLLQWLELHLDKRVPSSLLLLSRTLYLPEEISKEQQIKATISVLPENTAGEAQLHISEVSGERIDNKAKLEVIKQEQEMLNKEKKEAEEKKKKKQEAEKKAAAAELSKKTSEELAAQAAADAAIQAADDAEKSAAAAVYAAKKVAPLPDSGPVIPPPLPTSPPESTLHPSSTPSIDVTLESKDIEIKPEEILVDKAPIVEDKAFEDKSDEISREDVKTIEAVLDTVAEERLGIKVEQEELEELKEDVSSYKENLESLKTVIVETGGAEDDMRETKAAKRLTKHVDKLIGQINQIVDPMIEDRDNLLKDIKIDEGHITEPSPDDGDELSIEQGQQMLIKKQLEEKRANLISIDEMISVMRSLQTIPDETKLNTIMQVLDTDQDGVIDINDAIEVIEILSQDKVEVKAAHLSEIVRLLQKEAIIEEDEQKDAQKIETKAEKTTPSTSSSETKLP